MVEAEAEGVVELVADLERAILAEIRGRVADQIPRAAVGEKRFHVIATCLARRRRKCVDFAGSTFDGTTVEFGDHLVCVNKC